MQTNLDTDQIAAGVRVESRNSCPHLQRGSQTVARIDESGHHGVANCLHQRSRVPRNALLQVTEVPSNKFERLHVANAVVESGGSFQVGEEQREALDGEALAGRDRLSTEQFAERLVRKQLGP